MESYFRLRLLVVFVLAIAATRLQSQESSANLKEILDKAVTAHGGKEALAKLKTVRVTYTAKGAMPTPVGKELEIDIRVQETIDLPRRIKKVVTGKLDGRNVTVAWAAEHGKTDYWYAEDGKLQQMKFPMPFDIPAMQRIFQILEWFAETEPGSWKVVGSNAKRDELAFDKSSIVLVFDKETGLLKGSKNSNFSVGGRAVKGMVETSISHYREIEGLKLFTKTSNSLDGRKFIDLEVIDVKFLKELTDQDFAPPR